MTQLSSITFAAGAITSAYGAYSYCTAKGKQKNKQKESAKRVMAVGLGLLAVGAALHYFGNTQVKLEKSKSTHIDTEILDPNQENIAPDYLKPYVNALKGRAVPKTGAPLTKFPSHLAKFPHAGLLATKDGGICVIDDIDQLPPLEECEQRLSPFVKKIQWSNPERYAAATAHTNRWGKGYEFMIQRSGYNRFTFGMDKTIVTNYQEGLKTVEREFLQDPDFANASESSIVDSIKEIHKTFAKNVKHKDPGSSINPGVFREIGMLISDEKTERSLEGFKKVLKERNGSEMDFANLNSWFVKNKKYGSIEAASPHHTPEEIATLKKIVHVAIDFDKVPSAMLGFAKRLKEIYSLVTNKIVHPIAPAAWAHQECGDIHAFLDINGRVCRSVANSILEWGGIKGVVFPQEQSYTAAVQADQKSPGSLAGYFVDVINWNAMQNAFNS